MQLAFDFSAGPADPLRAGLHAAMLRAGRRSTYSAMPKDVADLWHAMMREIQAGARVAS